MKPFDIRNHLDNLEPNPKEKGKYICPVCGGNDLAVASTGDPPAYSCFSNGCAPKDIRNLIAPLAKGQRPPKTPQRRNADAARKANEVENKVTNLLMLITLGETTLEQAQVELSAWCQEHGHDRFAAGQLLRAKAKQNHSVSDSVRSRQATTDRIKPSDDKDSGDSVNQSVDSKGTSLEKESEALITDQEWIRFTQAMTTPGSFDPFHWLPERLAKIARTDAARNCIDPLSIWAYLFPATLSLMGRDTWLDMSGWKEPNVAWSLLIGRSGTGKSRALKLVLEPLKKRNQREFDSWKERVEDWAARERAKGKDKSDDDKPEPKPKCRRYLIQQSTPEGIVKLLASQEDNGVLAYRDEFAGFVKGLTQYSNGKGDGPEMLLETWDGNGLLVDRADEDKSFSVDSTRLSLAGGIQPGIFSKTFETSEDAQGQLARFLCVLPTELPYKRLKGASLLPAELGKVFDFIDRTDWGTILPTEAADDLFTEVSENFKNQKAPTVNTYPWLMKLPGHTLRLAMAIHALECYYDQTKDPKTLTADTMARAYHLAQHYQRHFYFLMGARAADGLEGILAKIQEAACASDCGVTPRDIARGAAGSRVEKMARAEGMKPAQFCLGLFRELADDGWGRVVESVGPKGHKRITYYADATQCVDFTDTLTESTEPQEHQGLRTVSEPLTEPDSITDSMESYTLKDTRNNDSGDLSQELEKTDAIPSSVAVEELSPPIPVGAAVRINYPDSVFPEDIEENIKAFGWYPPGTECFVQSVERKYNELIDDYLWRCVVVSPEMDQPFEVGVASLEVIEQ